MRFIETKKLNDYIIGTDTFLTDDVVGSLEKRLDSLNNMSLQDFSIEHDISFLHELSAVLNAIISIIYHPHLSNKHEEIITRTELAQQISRDDFLETIRDSKLWKEHNARMIPEEVHYRLHIDELRIYENRFIGFLVDVIDRELLRFSSFYLSKLPTLASADALDRNAIGETVIEIDRLRRKTQFIKGTYFYKEVSKGKPISRKIQPTNILLKDRLYRFCFKFYKNFSRYEDPELAKRDLRDYYTILIFKDLISKGFTLASQQNDRYTFESAEFSISLERCDDQSLSLTVTYKNLPDIPAKHLVVFDVDSDEAGSHEGLLDVDHIGVETLSPWELTSIGNEDRKHVFCGTEEELVAELISSKISVAAADCTIYKKYCPVCRARGVVASDEIYTCTRCDSSYTFEEGSENAKVWFRKIRK